MTHFTRSDRSHALVASSTGENNLQRQPQNAFQQVSNPLSNPQPCEQSTAIIEMLNLHLRCAKGIWELCC